MTAKPPPTPLRRFRFTRDQYREIAARGFFDNVPVELVFGLVYETESGDKRHSVSRNKALDQLRQAFDGIGHAGRISTVDLRDSDPRPDVCVIAGSSGSARLVVEIADGTLDYDLTTKAELYATAGVPEYWVLDVDSRQLHVFRDPAPLPLPTELAATAYRSHDTFGAADRVSPLAAPHASILVGDLLP